MNKAKKVVATFLLVVFLLISILYAIYINKQKSKDEIIFFYGITCPHCKNVEKFIEENNLDKTLKITKKEVYNNQNNLLELVKYAEKCGIYDDVGVPFIYYKGECYVGEEESINLLRSIAGD